MKSTLKLSLFLAFLSAIKIAYAQNTIEISPIPKISNEWRFEVTPYVWAPSITSTLSYNDHYINTAKLSTSSILGNLKSGGMIAAEAHYGNWGIFGDIVSATLQNTSGSPITIPYGGAAISGNQSNKVTLQQNMITGAVTYTLLKNQSAYVDGLVGARGIAATATVALNLSADGQSANLGDSKSVSTVDPIVGLKGRYRILDSSWYVPFYGDVGSGGGTTNITWQGILGVGKTFENWIDASLTYRYMYYDMNGDNLLQKTTFKGPQLAVTFKF